MSVFIDVVMLFQQFLQCIIVPHIILVKAEYVKSLGFGHESTFDTQPLLSNLFPALICKFITHYLLPFFQEEFLNS